VPPVRQAPISAYVLRTAAQTHGAVPADVSPIPNRGVYVPENVRSTSKLLNAQPLRLDDF
jgi:hypothetical protein